MNETNGHVIEISGPDKGMLKFVWEKMRSGVELTGGEIFVGRAWRNILFGFQSLKHSDLRWH